MEINVRKKSLDLEKILLQYSVVIAYMEHNGGNS